MGYGNWTATSYASYRTTTGLSVDDMSTASVSQIYTSHKLNSDLDPKGVVRECCDSEDHPNSFPVILALDVTGSMGAAAQKVAAKLNEIMMGLLNKVPDVQFMSMGIGDVEYDSAPVQASQFESDTRIAEQLEKIYFEHGGGGNAYETYTAAWWMGLRHCELDCWKRGKKGVIITLGDEPLNPYISKNNIKRYFGDNVQDDIRTEELYKQVADKFDVYHIAVDDHDTSYSYYGERVDNSFKKYLGQNFMVSTLDKLSDTITDIIKKEYDNSGGGIMFASVDTPNGSIAPTSGLKVDENGQIYW